MLLQKIKVFEQAWQILKTTIQNITMRMTSIPVTCWYEFDSYTCFLLIISGYPDLKKAPEFSIVQSESGNSSFVCEIELLQSPTNEFRYFISILKEGQTDHLFNENTYPLTANRIELSTDDIEFDYNSKVCCIFGFVNIKVMLIVVVKTNWIKMFHVK